MFNIVFFFLITLSLQFHCFIRVACILFLFYLGGGHSTVAQVWLNNNNNNILLTLIFIMIAIYALIPFFF